MQIRQRSHWLNGKSFPRAVGLNQLNLLCFREAKAVLLPFISELHRKVLSISWLSSSSSSSFHSSFTSFAVAQKSPWVGWGGVKLCEDWDWSLLGFSPYFPNPSHRHFPLLFSFGLPHPREARLEPGKCIWPARQFVWLVGRRSSRLPWVLLRAVLARMAASSEPVTPWELRLAELAGTGQSECVILLNPNHNRDISCWYAN